MFSHGLSSYILQKNLLIQFQQWGDLSLQSFLVAGSWRTKIFFKHASMYLIDSSWSAEFYIQTFCKKSESICNMSCKTAGLFRPLLYKSLLRFTSLLITARASYIWVNLINYFILGLGSLHSHFYLHYVLVFTDAYP